MDGHDSSRPLWEVWLAALATLATGDVDSGRERGLQQLRGAGPVSGPDYRVAYIELAPAGTLHVRWNDTTFPGWLNHLTDRQLRLALIEVGLPVAKVEVETRYTRLRRDRNAPVVAVGVSPSGQRRAEINQRLDTCREVPAGWQPQVGPPPSVPPTGGPLSREQLWFSKHHLDALVELAPLTYRPDGDSQHAMRRLWAAGHAVPVSDRDWAATATTAAAARQAAVASQRESRRFNTLLGAKVIGAIAAMLAVFAVVATLEPTPSPSQLPGRTSTIDPAETDITERRVGAICRDGWHSSATGSGACSHHGGVARWVYE